MRIKNEEWKQLVKLANYDVLIGNETNIDEVSPEAVASRLSEDAKITVRELAASRGFYDGPF
jgi:hypothetical protein